MSLLIAVAYAAVAALLLNLGLATRWPLPVKLGAVIMVSGLYVGTYVGLRAMEGWPTGERLPDHFRLHWVTVEEPDKKTASEGAIYMWLTELDERGQPTGEPRAHVLGWDAPTAKIARESLETLVQGRPINGSFRLGARDDEVPAFEANETGPPDLPSKPPR